MLVGEWVISNSKYFNFVMNLMARRSRVNFKVPKGIQSRNDQHQSPVHFKNLSDDVIDVFWIDYIGEPRFFGELMPINRNDQGLTFVTFVTHPFVAIYKRKIQTLLNGKRYFFPPYISTWNTNPAGWMNPRWNLQKESENIEENSMPSHEKYFEVIILPPKCMSLRKLCLIKCCELLEEDTVSVDIPSNLLEDMKLTRKKYFVG